MRLRAATPSFSSSLLSEENLSRIHDGWNLSHFPSGYFISKLESLACHCHIWSHLYFDVSGSLIDQFEFKYSSVFPSDAFLAEKLLAIYFASLIANVESVSCRCLKFRTLL